MNALLAACLVIPLAANPSHAAARSCGGFPSDFDGDGRADLAVAAPYDNARAGSVTVMYGNGRSDKLAQGSRGDSFGSALAVGDFDGDGCADLAVGVSEEVAGKRQPGADGHGAVRIYHGSVGGLRAGERLALPGVHGDRFGAALAAGDFDGDHRDELAVGAPGLATGGGVTVYWLKGRKPYTITQKTRWVGQRANVTDQWGATLATGDFDGDGVDELAVGAPTDTVTLDGQGSVTLLDPHRRQARQLTQSTPGITGKSEKWDSFGAALAGGDFNGDGRADLAVGVPGEGLSANQREMDYGDGTVDVLYGTAHGLSAARSEAWSQRSLKGVPRYYDRFGAALTAADLNGDGFDELAVGVPGERGVQVLAGSKSGGLTRRGNLLIKGKGRDFGAALGTLPATGGRYRLLSKQPASYGLVVAAPDNGTVSYLPLRQSDRLLPGKLRPLGTGLGLFGYALS